MSININLEFELDSIIGPYSLDTEDRTTTTNFYIVTKNKTLGVFSEAFVQLNDSTIKAVTFKGRHLSARNTLEALIVRGVLEDLLKDAGVSIEADLIGLYTNGYINVSPEVSDLIKTLLRGKRNSLLKED